MEQNSSYWVWVSPIVIQYPWSSVPREKRFQPEIARFVSALPAKLAAEAALGLQQNSRVFPSSFSFNRIILIHFRI